MLDWIFITLGIVVCWKFIEGKFIQDINNMLISKAFMIDSIEGNTLWIDDLEGDSLYPVGMQYVRCGMSYKTFIKKLVMHIVNEVETQKNEARLRYEAKGIV